MVDLLPREPEIGERIEVSGTGFPEGSASTLTFRGDLCRAGEPTVRDASIVARATNSHGNRVSLLLTDELAAQFSGTGAEAAHTTFRGEVSAAFAPRRTGAPPIVGTLRDVTLDLPPPLLSEQVLEQRRAEAARVALLLGLELRDDPARGGILVTGLRPQGLAEQAGLSRGDVLMEFDGTRVRQSTDLMPRAGQRFSRVLVKRSGAPEPLERVLPVEGVRPAAPAELTMAAVMVGLAAAILLLFGAPGSRLLSWTEDRLASRLRAAALAGRRTRGSRLGWFGLAVRGLASELRQPPGRLELWRVPPYLGSIAVTGLFTALALGSCLVAPELDLPLVLAGSMTSLLGSALIAGGAAGARWSLGRGLKCALAALGCQLPVLGGCLVVSLRTASLRPDLLVESQGALPWQWAAFRGPVEFAAFLLLMLALVPETSAVPAELPGASSRSESAPNALASLFDWSHLLTASFLVALLFLGGWKLPFVSESVGRSSLTEQGIGAACLGVKAWAMVLGVLATRWAVGRVRVDEVSSISWRWLVPLSITTVGLAVASGYVPRSALLHSLGGIMSIVLFGLCAFLVLRLGRRVVAESAKAGSQLGVSPWL